MMRDDVNNEAHKLDKAGRSNQIVIILKPKSIFLSQHPHLRLGWC